MTLTSLTHGLRLDGVSGSSIFLSGFNSPSVLPSEIFPLHLRSTGISITTSITWISNFVVGLVSPRMLTTSKGGLAYFTFGGFSLLALLSAMFLYPETKGRSLEEMDAAFGDNTADSQREHLECIYRELGLPVKALLTA
ncbi:hypothetical protein AZE42_01614 [Rhizopogon vesiculosus]|uniref:Major facilitator superfamily (MFS) profile domain-containing protein n=1 Tax=Rhizopogon vesiculosus TaxID=180088 RepID=A0A1J8QHY7_9AGAM|nr:hypothetical protein AZE42_01614 [Rhizopogon vesiculosus]